MTCSTLIPWLLLANLIFWLVVVVVVYRSYPGYVEKRRRNELSRFANRLRSEYDTGIDEATDVTSTTFVEWNSDTLR